MVSRKSGKLVSITIYVILRFDELDIRAAGPLRLSSARGPVLMRLPEWRLLRPNYPA